MPDLWKSDVVDADFSRRTQRTTRRIEKGMQYRLELMRESIYKLHGKLLRKSSMIDEMTYSWVSATAIREEMDQFNHTIKLLMSAHEEYLRVLTDEQQAADSELYDQFDENVLSFKRKMVKWLKEDELNNEEMKSRMILNQVAPEAANQGVLKVAQVRDGGKGAKARARAKVLGTFGDVSLQTYKKDDNC